MPKRSIAPILLCTLFAGCVIVAEDNEIEVINDSRFDIYELYVTDDGVERLSDEVLFGDVLRSGESILLGGIPCGTYDVIVYDEDDVRCELRNVDVCLGETATWHIDTFTLIGCEF